MERLSGAFKGRRARITKALEWGFETNFGMVAFSEIGSAWGFAHRMSD